MKAAKVEGRRFTVSGTNDIEFCPVCGVTLDEAIDHETSKGLKGVGSTLICRCPEKPKTSGKKALFCPRCGENISSKEQQKLNKHEVENISDNTKSKVVTSVVCPLEKKTLKVTIY
jgi:hypothetical protein